jgi:von Willebrand factor type A domain/von Willebrand factor type A C-terminal domain
MANFTLECFQNEYLADGAEDVNAIVTVKARGLPSSESQGESAPPSAAVAMMIDVSGSMNGEKIRQARKAAIAAIDCVRDGVRFAVIAGNHNAVQVWPPSGLGLASAGSRAKAGKAVEKLQAGGGTRIATWIAAATELLSEETGVRQAILLTDGKDENETPDDLAAAVADASGVFQCDCRGVGTDWVVAELRLVADALLGTVDIVANPADLTADFEVIMGGAMRKQAPDVMLRVWAPQGAEVRFLKQVVPHITDLTDIGSPSGNLSTDYPTGSWGVEDRDYHLAIRVKPGAVGEEMLAARVTVVVDGQPAGQALIRAVWTDEVDLSTRINPRVAQATGEEELASAIDQGIQALNEGDKDTAAVRFGRAKQLADAAGDQEKSDMLSKLVEEDPSTGRVKLKPKIEKLDAMTLDARSRKTTRVRR